MQKEIEIKFRCSKKSLASLATLTKLPLDYSFEAPYPFETLDIYFDTRSNDLLKQGASLRCRKKGDQLRVTFKSNPVRKGNQLIREEWEEEVSEEVFQALLESGRVPDFCAAAVRGFVGKAALFSVLEVQNHRKIRRVLHDDRGQVAEMSLDDVLFVRNGKQASYFGIEVELKEFGNEGDLKAISKGLMERFPELASDAETKFEKGMRLLV